MVEQDIERRTRGSTVVRVEVEADVLERQVDARGEDGGRQDDGDDLRLEGILAPRV